MGINKIFIFLLFTNLQLLLVRLHILQDVRDYYQGILVRAKKVGISCEYPPREPQSILVEEFSAQASEGPSCQPVNLDQSSAAK